MDDAITHDRFRTGQVNDAGKIICGGRTKNCGGCGHRYKPRYLVDEFGNQFDNPESEYDLTACPNCGNPRPCRNTLINRDNGRCRMHGGATLKGREHPRYTSGKRSRYAPPAPIREGYERALADPMLHNLRDELALLDAILQDQLDEYEAGLSGDLWRQVQQAAGRSLDDLTRIGAAMQSSPPDAQAFRQSYSDLQVNLGEVMRLATRGRDIPGVRTEIGGTIDRIARVADKGQTIAIRDRMVMSFDTAYQIFDQFWTDVRLEIHDPDTIRSLGQILNRILEGVEQAQQLPGE